MLSGWITPLVNNNKIKKVAFTEEAPTTILSIILIYQQYLHTPKAGKTPIEGVPPMATIHQ